MVVRIKEADSSDTNTIFTLIQAKAKFDGQLDQLRSNEETIKTAFFSEHPKIYALLAIVANNVVGFATYYYIYSTVTAKPGIWLDDLYVYPEAQGSGSGQALLKKLCTIAKQAECGRIDWIVGRENENAIAFYKTFGAEVFEDVRHARLDEEAIRKLSGK